MLTEYYGWAPWFTDFPQGTKVLDLGFGRGDLLRDLRDRKCDTYGLEFDRRLVEKFQAEGFNVCLGRAEELPYEADCFDAVVCSVVVPYTRERRAIAEIARVLKPGGTVNMSFHGIGYALNYLGRPGSWKLRFYGLRMLLNTGCYWATRARLPGPLGDTLIQTRRQLRHHYRRYGLKLVREEVKPEGAAFPLFIYHQAKKISRN